MQFEHWWWQHWAVAGSYAGRTGLTIVGYVVDDVHVASFVVAVAVEIVVVMMLSTAVLLN